VHQIECGIVGLKMPVTIEIQPVVLVEQDFERWPDGHVRAHGSVEREQGVRARDLQRGGIVLNPAIEDRPAVFDFTDLQIGGAFGRAEGVSLGINEEQVWLLALDLAAQQEMDIEFEVVFLERRAIKI
jgi:hypothetical protein